MKTILRAGHAKFYAAGGARGVPMRFDTVRYSSVGRLVSRTASEGERREVDAIRKHHSVDGSIYRILPRSLDAALFGGLDRLVPNLDKARSIEVAYRLEGRQLLVDLISIDGNRAAGTISLGAFRSECAGNP
ncbi:MAG: hypothetical protein GKS00_24640 [Alphaproteobacteria bacterium]|nr:hypothetical protein [Alphaproteobacteria bacterium]